MVDGRLVYVNGDFVPDIDSVINDCSIVHSIKGLPETGMMFLLGISFDPLLAGMNDTTSIINEHYS